MTPRVPPQENPELLALALGRTSECPPLERLAAAALGDLTEAERAALLAHAERCPACGAEVALAAGFAEPGGVDDAEVERVVERLRAAGPGAGRVLAFPAPRAAGARSAAPVWARWAAAALVVLGVGFLWQASRTALPPEITGPGTIDVVRGGEIEVDAPVGEVIGVPGALSWRPVAGAALYRVELLDVAGDPLGGGETVATRFELDPALAGRLRERARYAWRVSALDASGRELARSAVVEISILPVSK